MERKRSRRRSKRRVRDYHKAGSIGTYSLAATYLHDSAETGEREVIQQMAKRIAERVKVDKGLAEQSN